MEVMQRKSDERGVTKTPWLLSQHTFSFGDYVDSNYRRFHTLRVINQDVVQPKTGFSLHPHHDMEIITVVLKGEVTHQDSMGNKTKIKAGEIQLMSAGSGVTHGEWNESNEVLELLQIWIFPDQKHLAPSYQQMAYQKQEGKLIPLVQPIHQNDEKNVLMIHQDASLYLGALKQKQKLNWHPTENKALWIQMIGGNLKVNAHLLASGDGLGLTDIKELNFVADSDCEWLLFELAK